MLCSGLWQLHSWCHLTDRHLLSHNSTIENLMKISFRRLSDLRPPSNRTKIVTLWVYTSHQNVERVFCSSALLTPLRGQHIIACDPGMKWFERECGVAIVEMPLHDRTSLCTEQRFGVSGALFVLALCEDDSGCLRHSDTKSFLLRIHFPAERRPWSLSGSPLAIPNHFDNFVRRGH